MTEIKKVRYYIFLKDIFLLSLTAFGGPQAHIAMFTERLVLRHKYISEEELLELFALCQILPGPTSTQTITAIGYRLGKAKLAYLTLLVWCLPAVSIMTIASLSISYFQANNISTEFTRYIQPMAVGVVFFSSYSIIKKVIKTKTSFTLMVFSAGISYFINSPYLLPVLLLLGGSISALKFNQQPLEEKNKLDIKWANFFLFAGVFIGFAILGNIIQSKPILLFENFYRNGSLIFGGGQVLIPLLFTEFVEFKEYLSSEEFLSGYAISQALPGPVFSFTSYVGGLSMREYGLNGQLLGGLMAMLGIFLPGTFLIFFIIHFWDGLKKFRIVRASLEGINAVSSGLVLSAAVLLFEPIPNTLVNYLIVGLTIGILFSKKVPVPFLIIAGLLAGFLI